MRSLIERHGGEPTVVASMQEVPLEDNTVAVEFSERLLAGEVDYVVFMTGVGAETLRSALEASNQFDGVLDHLTRVTVILRGPKPKAVLHKWGLRDWLEVREPNTWRELVELVDEQQLDLAGKTLAIQEYGITNPELNDALKSRGANVYSVPVYRWKLPDDTKPLLKAINQTVSGEFDALLFTSANQMRNVVKVAAEAGLRDDFISAASKCLVASIGPTCSEAIREAGLEPGFEASPPKMGQLVRGVMQSFDA